MIGMQGGTLADHAVGHLDSDLGSWQYRHSNRVSGPSGLDGLAGEELALEGAEGLAIISFRSSSAELFAHLANGSQLFAESITCSTGSIWEVLACLMSQVSQLLGSPAWNLNTTSDEISRLREFRRRGRRRSRHEEPQRPRHPQPREWLDATAGVGQQWHSNLAP